MSLVPLRDIGTDVDSREHGRLLAKESASPKNLAVVGLGSLLEFLSGDLVTDHLFKADRAYFHLFA